MSAGPEAPVASRAGLRLRHQILLLAGTRGVLNTGFRLAYPFLPALARGVNVDLATAALAVTSARALMGLSAPWLGVIADRLGRRLGLIAAGLAFALGLLPVWLSPTYAALFLAINLTSLAKVLFDASMQAHLGDVVHYRRRGAAIALTEFSWAGSFLVGIPLVGWLIDRGGWQAPFPWLAGLALLMTLLLWRAFPADRPLPTGRPLGARRTWGRMLRSPILLAALGTAVLMDAANEAVTIVYGAWMEQAFGLHILALGAATTVLGLAELGGEGLVALVADRFGKRRSVVWGLVGNSLAALALPALSGSVPGALVVLFVFYLTFEFTIVSLIPMMTEVLPEVRATVMAATVSAFSLGRALGAYLGPHLFTGDILPNAALAVALNLAALLLLRRVPLE